MIPEAPEERYKEVKEVGVKFGIVVPFERSTDSRGSEFLSQIMTYLSGLENHFDSAWIPDHLVPFTPPFLGGTLECLTTISYLLGIFKKFKFGSLVLCNSFRNPSLVAKIGATLDFLTGGRFILGIGAGWNESEYVQYGYSFPPPAVRIEQLKEGVQIIKSMWSEGQVTFEGKYFRVKNARCSPKPDPPPPIMIGGGGEKLTLKVVARYADWWNLDWADLSTYEYKLDFLRHYCSRIGRDSNEIVKTLLGAVVIADTDEDAMKIAKKRIGYQNFTFRDLARFVGSVDTVKAKIGEFVDIGVEHFILAFLPLPRLDGPLLFAKEVIPEFKQSKR